MKITNVEAIIVRQPEIALIGDGTQDTAIIRVYTDEGIVGIGEVDSAPYVVKAVIDMPASHSACMGLKEVLIGEDPFDIERLWYKMYELSYYHGRLGAVIHAMSGIDIALWDIMGKALKMPVHKLLGGSHRTEIPAYISILMPDTEDEIARLVDYHMSRGYKGIKFGWGALGQSYEKDVRLVKAARKYLGSDPLLMIDIGMVWNDYKTALKTCRAFEEHDVFWVEEPFRVDRKEDFSALRAATEINITAGEELGSLHEFKEYIDKGCVDILQPDMSRCGGLTMAKKIADMAYLAGHTVVPHNFKSGILMAATLQYIAAIPNAFSLEFCGQETVLSRMLITEGFKADSSGYVKIPGRPGLGVEISEETLNKYRVG